MQQTNTPSHTEEYGANDKKLRERIQELQESSRANHQAAADFLQVIRKLGDQRKPRDILQGAKIAIDIYEEAVQK